VTCLHCGARIPAGSRRDRVYCNNSCSALASYYRRKNGAAPPPRWQHPALESANPSLRAAADRARQLGETHGWSPSTIRCTLDGLTVLLDGRPAGERVTLTEIRTRTSRHTSAPRVAEVLAGLDLLEDDSIPAVRPGSSAAPASCPRVSPGRSGPGCWCCSTATPGPGPGHTPASTSTSPPSSRSSSSGQQSTGTSARSPPMTSGSFLIRCAATSCALRPPRSARCSGSPGNAD
jgi:hypothetical protein